MIWNDSPQELHPSFHLRHRQESEAVEHATKQLDLVLLPVRHRQSNLLNSSPRTLAEVVKTPLHGDMWAQDGADCVDDGHFEVADAVVGSTLQPLLSAAVTIARSIASYSC